MKTITKLGVLSVAKIQALITGTLYLIMSIAANLVGMKNPELVQQAGLQIGWGTTLVYILTGLVAGFVLGAVVAYLYNMLSPKIGGIQIELKSN